MKTLLRALAVLAILGAVAATASADPIPGPAGPACGPGGCAPGGCAGAACGGCPGRYGLNPCLKWILTCGRYRTPKCNPTPPPKPCGGTLVFPNHPFARGPRDYFMVEDAAVPYGPMAYPVRNVP